MEPTKKTGRNVRGECACSFYLLLSSAGTAGNVTKKVSLPEERLFDLYFWAALYRFDWNEREIFHQSNFLLQEGLAILHAG